MKASVPEQLRLTSGVNARLRFDARLVSDVGCGRNGMFLVPCLGQILRCMISDGEGWEHVSVSLANRCPTWAEMCFVKDLFWDAEETVIQFHPPKSKYVNCHPYCLHLWRSQQTEYATPPSIFVGPKP